jgi:hypothetical protein
MTGCVNGRFMTIMIPHYPFQKPLVKRLKTVPNSFGVKIDFGDFIVFAYDHKIIEAEDIVVKRN